MSKKKSSNKRKKSQPFKNLRYINYSLFGLVIIFVISLLYYYDKKSTEIENRLKNPIIIETNKDINKPYQLKIDKEYMRARQDKFEEFTKEFEKEYVDETQIEIEKEIEVKEDTRTDILEEKDNRPKLAIIIDDVTTQSQVNKINNIGYIVNMSFLPPTDVHPNSAKIAQNLPFYMIHFPMEASNFKNEESITLHVGDSYERIENIVKKLKEQYPKAKFINNHTGSKFTADEESMDKLFSILKKYDFIFLDSRTTHKTVAKKYAKKYNIPFLTRNVFLDNSTKHHDILEQLKKAVFYAKKNGYAIAIGHPYKQTIEVLESSKELLKDINLVYVKDIPTL